MSQADPSTSPHAIQPPPPPPAPDPAILATPAPISYAPYLDKQDPALLTAWRRLEDYSYVSTDRKVAYTRLRSAVIWTGFATSALAVLSAYIPDWLASVGLMGAFSEVATFLIRAALVVLPILSVGLLSAEAVVGVQVGYSIADVAAKCGYGLVIYAIARAKTEAEGGLATAEVKPAIAAGQ